jgi:inhibitor of cysteine peptidase
MKKVLAISFLLLMLGTIIISCGGTAAVVEYTDVAKAIETKVGQQFTIVLDANATTGYQWQSVIDAAYLKQVKSEYKATDSKPGVVGAGGKQYFIYEAIKAGSTEIKMTYKRSWEATGGDQKTFKVTIK